MKYLMQGVIGGAMVRWLSDSIDWAGADSGGAPTLVALASPESEQAGEILDLTVSRDALSSDANRLLRHSGAGAITYTIQTDTFSKNDRLAFVLTGTGSIIVDVGGTAVVRVIAGKTLTLGTQYGMALLTVLGEKGDVPQEHLLSGDLA